MDTIGHRGSPGGADVRSILVRGAKGASPSSQMWRPWANPGSSREGGQSQRSRGNGAAFGHLSKAKATDQRSNADRRFESFALGVASGAEGGSGSGSLRSRMHRIEQSEAKADRFSQPFGAFHPPYRSYGAHGCVRTSVDSQCVSSRLAEVCAYRGCVLACLKECVLAGLCVRT